MGNRQGSCFTSECSGVCSNDGLGYSVGDANSQVHLLGDVSCDQEIRILSSTPSRQVKTLLLQREKTTAESPAAAIASSSTCCGPSPSWESGIEDRSLKRLRVSQSTFKALSRELSGELRGDDVFEFSASMAPGGMLSVPIAEKLLSRSCGADAYTGEAQEIFFGGQVLERVTGSDVDSTASGSTTVPRTFSAPASVGGCAVSAPVGRFPQDVGGYVGGYDGDGRRHGDGILSWPDGRQYSGEFRHGVFEGRAVMIWPDGRRYVGQYADNAKEGNGLFTWPDGRRYCGQWGLGKRHGKGLYTNAKGQARMGVWDIDRPISWEPPEHCSNSLPNSFNKGTPGKKDNSIKVSAISWDIEEIQRRAALGGC